MLLACHVFPGRAVHAGMGALVGGQDGGREDRQGTRWIGSLCPSAQTSLPDGRGAFGRLFIVGGRAAARVGRQASLGYGR